MGTLPPLSLSLPVSIYLGSGAFRAHVDSKLSCFDRFAVQDDAVESVSFPSPSPLSSFINQTPPSTRGFPQPTYQTQYDEKRKTDQKTTIQPFASPQDKSGKQNQRLGLFSYPVLQAADILVHGYVGCNDQQRSGNGGASALPFAFKKKKKKEKKTNWSTMLRVSNKPPQPLKKCHPRPGGTRPSPTPRICPRLSSSIQPRLPNEHSQGANYNHL